MPKVLRSRRRLPAGVKLPAASDRRGVHAGGAIWPFPTGVDFLVNPGRDPLPSKPALARRLLEALSASFRDMTSREEILGMWNGVLGGGKLTASSGFDIIRGVAFNVPHVMSCFTAAGPSSDGVGDGRLGTRKNSSLEDDEG